MVSFTRRYVLSRWTSLSLVTAVVGMCLVGLLVPQEGAGSPQSLARWMAEHPSLASISSLLGLFHIFSTPMFLIVTVLLFCAMAWSTFEVAKSVLRRERSSGEGVDRLFDQRMEFPDGHTVDLADISEALQRRSYRVLHKDEGTGFVSAQHDWSKWGSTILHAGMLFVIVGSLVYALTERRGYFQVLEGDTFFGATDELLARSSGLLAPPLDVPYAIGLDRVNAEYYANGELRSVSSTVRIASSKDKIVPAIVSVNAAGEAGAALLYQSNSIGFAAGLILRYDGTSQPMYFSLERVSSRENRYAGVSEMAGTGLAARMDLSFDMSKPSHSNAPALLHLVVERSGRQLLDRTLVLGDQADFDGGNVRFADVRRWSGFILTQTPGVTPVFIGFGLVLVGIIALYAFPRREIAVWYNESSGERRLTIGGRCRREKALFAEEFRAVVEEVYLTEGTVDVRPDMVEV
jgi:cytochrome c biogenesis protein ResB